jgi:hypothetical protein
MNKLKTHQSPAPQAAVLPGPGTVAPASGGAPIFIENTAAEPGSGTNMVQVNQTTGTNLAMAMNVASPAAATITNLLQQASMQTLA